jgi:hypothetical protein
MVKRAVVGAAIVAGVGAGLARRLRARARARHSGTDRWMVVTVNCPPERLVEVPEPLARLSKVVDTRVGPAPGGKGSELAARLRVDGSLSSGMLARLAGDDPRQTVRSALRDAKSLVETGEILRPDTPPTTRRTAKGGLMEIASRRAGGEGRL